MTITSSSKVTVPDKYILALFNLPVPNAQLLLTPATDEGACGGELACSTCHLVFEKEVYDTLPPKTDEEEDMLDLAFELTET